MNRSVKKERLRIELLEMRRKMAFEDVFKASSRIQKRFLDSRYCSSVSRFSLYSSFQNEVLTDEIFLNAHESGKDVFYPRVLNGSGLGFFRVHDLKDLSMGTYRIPEPRHGDPADPGSFDLMVVPGIAFDLKGGRIGYGKGYYDMVLKGVGCPIIALAYSFQVLNVDIPTEAHDVKVSAIITEKEIIRV